MAKLVAKWHKVLEAEILQRSSQVVSVIDKQAYVFGGELRPREPRDNDVHVLSLDGSEWLTTPLDSHSCQDRSSNSATARRHPHSGAINPAIPDPARRHSSSNTPRQALPLLRPRRGGNGAD